MTKISLCVVAALLFVLASLCQANKYADVNNMDKERPFRMSKINTAWERGRKFLRNKKLTDFYAELVVQDRQFKELKYKKHHSDDVDGLYEAEVQRSFVGLLEKYNLIEHFPEERRLNQVRDFERMDKPRLKDDKLKKLWKKASQEGFSDQELKTLQEELSHHQLKLDEYNALKSEYDLLQENVDNSLDNLDEQEDHWKKLEKTKRQMKEKHLQIKDHYSKVKQKMDGAEKEEGEFSDPRVYHLWALAQKSGMSESELSSIKKELSHFENRIRKAEHAQEQLNKSETKLSGNSALDKKVFQDLQERAKHYHKKVDKYHEDLTYRIQKRLDEL